jgi:hypothetical protein
MQMCEYADVQMKFNIDIENLNLKLRFSFLWEDGTILTLDS